jgi:SAM-dependent methyltransferase
MRRRQPVYDQRRVDVATRLCLLLGAGCRHIFRFQDPVDPLDPGHPDRYFEYEVAKSRRVPRRFPVAGLDVLELGCGYGGLLKVLRGASARPVGVDVEATRVKYAKSRGLDAVCASADALPFPDGSFDVVVSDAVLEHLTDIAACLRESHRVLRPAGWFYALWGPTWLSYNGPHLLKALGVPWVHLLFPERTIVRALEAQRGRVPAAYIDDKIADYRTMGRVTRRRLRAAATNAGFTIVEEASETERPVKRALAQLPLFDELLAGQAVAAFRKG